MNEPTARRVLLIQAFETAAPDGPLWTAEDRQWAHRVASDAVGPQATADAYVAERAHHAMQRLGPRAPALAHWLMQPGWRWQWLLIAVVLAFAVGAAADSIGSAQRINLLAPPLWTVVVWNLAVYVLLLWGAVAGLLRRRSPPSTPPGRLRRAVQRLIERSAPITRQLPPQADARGADAASNASTAPVLAAYAHSWGQHSAPLLAARAAAVLHAAAAALALGLIAGMYVRGLVLDYRVGWQSTFLSSAQVHAGLTTLLGPVASLVSDVFPALQLPDLAAVDALRLLPNAVPNGVPNPLPTTVPIGAVADGRAATWIHLYALTLALVVMLPRSLLALWALLRAAYGAHHFALPMSNAYFARLVRQQLGSTARLQVLPYANAPTPAATLGLRRVLASVFGDTVRLDVLPTTTYGSSAAAATAPVDCGVSVALFDMGATPEAQSQGRFVSELLALASRSATPGTSANSPPPALLIVVDESAFRRRFAGSPERITQRCAAWQQLAASMGSVAVVVDLEQPDLPAAERALQAALDRPVRAMPVP
jgi:hypothetical protein